jgi:branched-chain amino acid transport system substrate-binding protein
LGRRLATEDETVIASIRRLAVVLVALGVTVGLAACGSSGGDDTGSATSGGGGGGETTAEANSALNGKVTLGAIAPLTGPSATIGQDQARGIELAVEKVNSEDGVMGKELAVQVEDSEATTAASVQAARKLVTSNHVPLVIGEYLSANTIAAGKYLEGAGVVQINPGSSSPEIAEIGEYSFSTIGLDDLAGKVAAKNLADAGVKKIAFLGPNNSYGAEFAKVLAKEFPKTGGEIVESILFTEGQSSYQPELNRLKESDAEVWVYATYDPEAVTINTEAFQLDMNPKQFYGIYLSICVEGVEPAAIAGQQGQDLAYIGPKGEGYEKEYEARFDSKPKTPYSGYAYDAVMMAAAAINKAKSTEPDAIREALKEVGKGYEGATGDITFDANNQREEAPYEVLEVNEEGELVPEPKFEVSSE